MKVMSGTQIEPITSGPRIYCKIPLEIICDSRRLRSCNEARTQPTAFTEDCPLSTYVGFSIDVVDRILRLVGNRRLGGTIHGSSHYIFVGSVLFC